MLYKLLRCLLYVVIAAAIICVVAAVLAAVAAFIGVVADFVSSWIPVLAIIAGIAAFSLSSKNG